METVPSVGVGARGPFPSAGVSPRSREEQAESYTVSQALA